jgi:hypothetical protein
MKNMKMKTKTLYILLIIILMGCQSEKSKTGDISVIDFSKNYPEEEIRLWDIADVEYVPLETTDDVVVGRGDLYYVSDKYIVIGDRSQDEIFIFNRKGKIVSHFNRRGQGPQEYIKLGGHVIFDEKEEEIIICHMLKHDFLVYSMSGEYKRSFKYPEDWMIGAIHNFDDETMLVYNDDRMVKKDNYSEKPYMLVSKKDGSIVSILDICLPVRYTTRVSQQIDMGGGKIGTTASYFQVAENPYDGQNLVIADMSSDTIYRLSRTTGELTPLLVRTPSVHSSDPPTVWGVLLTTDKFIILSRTTLDRIAFEQGRDKSPEYLMYEFETGQTRQVWFRLMLSHFGVDIPKNMFAKQLSPMVFKKIYEKLYNGEPVKMPDDEDNDIVAIYKLK